MSDIQLNWWVSEVAELTRPDHMALTGWNPNTLGWASYRDAGLAVVGGVGRTVRLWNPDAGHGHLDGLLRTLADTGDEEAATRLADRLAGHGDLDGLRARAAERWTDLAGLTASDECGTHRRQSRRWLPAATHFYFYNIRVANRFTNDATRRTLWTS